MSAAVGERREATAVLHVGGIYRGSEHAVVMKALRRRPGVVAVEANPVAQTATVTYDPRVTSVAQLRTWVTWPLNSQPGPVPLLRRR